MMTLGIVALILAWLDFILLAMAILVGSAPGMFYYGSLLIILGVIVRVALDQTT